MKKTTITCDFCESKIEIQSNDFYQKVKFEASGGRTYFPSVQIRLLETSFDICKGCLIKAVTESFQK